MKTKVALLIGGFTEESDISFKSGSFVESNIDKDLFEVFPITITTNSWFYVSDSGIKHEINRQDFSLMLDEHFVRFDIAFIMIHGTPGEDGRIQGYFDMIGLPYTSCDMLTSAITMNKAYTKALLCGIKDLNLAKSITLTQAHRENAFQRVNESLEYPLFVKPNAGGSSIGMSRVNEEAELQAALDKAYDVNNMGHQVIVEEFVTGREFSQGIFRDLDGSLVLLPASEIKTDRDFFDYEAKYTKGLADEITPADITPEEKQRIDKVLSNIYERLNCKGIVRVDYFLEKETGDLYFLEMNTVPGQTEQSFIPQQVRAHGMSEREFYTKIIQSAIANSLHMR